ncbi:PhzF family phenazine biosynthesis isomerase [Lysobacter sp. Hz 25]|uniref:PhzF family phenazine biosynthesis isomerase n=1 Tax=Lysobacter sp. Hz 25 TaxID=3383698 RepID=UPI0038D3E104
MTDLRVYQIDAFTRQRYQGNPAGVVANAEGLSDEHMQLIARELNNSETAFILPAEAADHDLRVRFFTPTTEVPVCGHATVAAHFVLALERGLPAKPCRQLTGAGIQVIETLRSDDGFRIAIEQNRPSFEPKLSRALAAEVAAALGVDARALDPRCPVQFVSTGHGKLLVGLRERRQLQALVPDAAQLIALGPKVGAKGFFVFSLDREDGDDALTHGRMFAPAIGIAEDPVTGNANGPLGAYLVKHGLLEARDGVARFRARQQAGNGRGGQMDVTVRVERGEPSGVRIEGDAVTCFWATLPRTF